MDWTPIARIILRYLVGAAIMGSDEIGVSLSSDPDLVMVAALAIGATVEGAYAWAKKRGGAT
jgi:hypothetical protein